MRRLTTLTLTLALGAFAMAPLAAADPPRTIRMMGTDALKFSLPTITAKPGEMLTIVLRTMSVQPAHQLAHNFVLLKPTAKVDAYIMAAAMARQEDYLPAAQKANVITATRLAAAGETAQVTFQAPEKAGTYPYVCTFPGHYNGGMKGTLIVK
jgi:azurin